MTSHNDITENMIGPTEKLDLPPCWTEINENDSYYYLRQNTYYMATSMPAPYPGYTCHTIGNKYYIVKDKIKYYPKIQTIDELLETTHGKMLKSMVTNFMRENSIQTFDYIYGTINEERQLNIHDIFILMSQNFQISLQILKYIEEKVNEKIDNGEICESDMWYMMNNIAGQLGIYTDEDNVNIWNMINRETNIIGPVDHKIVLMPYWDEIEDCSGNYYYLQKDKYTLCPDEIFGPHQVILIGGNAYFVME